MALISVLFPAPLSPTRATISPESTSKSTSCRARTGPKLLENPRSARRCSGGGPLPLPLDSASPPATPGLILLPHRHLADPSCLTGRLELVRADLVCGPVPVWADQRLTAVGHRLDVVLGRRLRRQQVGRDIGRTVVGLRLLNQKTTGRDRLALSQCNGDLRRCLGLGPGRLVDGHVLGPIEDPLD